MNRKPQDSLAGEANNARYHGQRDGFYESYFQRANHPTRPLGFWTRYTVFSPRGRPQDAIGEVWAVLFDGETGAHAVAKEELPFAQRCVFSPDRLAVSIGDSTLREDGATGAPGTGSGRISWSLAYKTNQPPLFLFPEALYRTSLPRAKVLVPAPLAAFNGFVAIADRRIAVDGWLGSLNHNWGTRHTDHYAWGQVAGFDNAPDSFLEVATARLRFGRFWTPPLTTLVLRHAGEEIALRSPWRAIKAEAAFSYFDWSFRSEDSRYAVQGSIRGRVGDFVGLRYANPPGGDKHCLNTKIAACSLTVQRKSRGRFGTPQILETSSRAAFEILTDDRAHPINISA